MIFLHTLLLAAALMTSMQERFREYRLQLKAYSLYDRRAYSQAESAFRQLATLVPEQKERMVARYNLACALSMQGKYPDAASLFAQNTKPDNEYREIRLKSLYNEGATLALRAIGSSAKEQKTALFRQSLSRFRSLLLADAGDGEAKLNYEIVRRYLSELEAPKRSKSSSAEKKSSPQPSSGISQEVADRLLENAQQNESSLMRQLPRTGASAGRGGKNNKDW